MKIEKGTPKTLKESIENGLEEGSAANIQLCVQDFLAQHFGAQMLKNSRNTEAQEALQSLWARITGVKK